MNILYWILCSSAWPSTLNLKPMLWSRLFRALGAHLSLPTIVTLVDGKCQWCVEDSLSDEEWLAIEGMESQSSLTSSVCIVREAQSRISFSCACIQMRC